MDANTGQKLVAFYRIVAKKGTHCPDLEPGIMNFGTWSGYTVLATNQ